MRPHKNPTAQGSTIMRKRTLAAFSILTVFIFLFLHASLFAESPQNRDAIRWYNKGLQSQDVADKLKAFQAAIRIDPQFGQAHFQLALVYNQQRNYNEAQKHLETAYSIKQGNDVDKIRFNAAFTLARLYKSQKQYGEAVSYYQFANELVPTDQLKSTLNFELATCYFRLEKFDESLARAQEGMKLSSDNKIYFQNFLAALENARDIANNYKRAKEIMKGDSLLEARVLLANINKKSPDYKDVPALMAQIDSLLARKEKVTLLTSLYNEGLRYEKENKFELAIATFEQILAQDNTFKDASDRLAALEKRIFEKNKDSELQNAYTEGIVAMESKEWTHAIIAFERVIKTDAGFKDAAKKLQVAKNNLKSQNQSLIIERFYADGKQAIFARNWGAALVALEKVKNINPNFKDVQILLAEVEERISSSLTSDNNTTIDLKTASMLDSLYTEAQGYIHLEDWFKSVSLLEKIQIIKPGYRDVIDLLATARTNLALSNNDLQNSIAMRNKGNSTLYYGGILFSLVFFPLLGFVLFVPHARAKAFTLIGKHHLAANIYEKLLQENPGKLKLYSPLANAYLINGRRDQKALELFSTILKLNLNIPNRKQLEKIVQQKYLARGSRSSEAIQAFKDASKSSHSHSQ
ncbi:MAG: hypothetical protein DWQ10_14675 [Calditrichaeota bacterium]|nr:MAG: hypothetical protein DWQ10_14675 [Calditrichota bacterium]